MDAWNRDDPTLLINILAPKEPPDMNTAIIDATKTPVCDRLADRVYRYMRPSQRRAVLLSLRR